MRGVEGAKSRKLLMLIELDCITREWIKWSVEYLHKKFPYTCFTISARHSLSKTCCWIREWKLSFQGCLCFSEQVSSSWCDVRKWCWLLSEALNWIQMETTSKGNFQKCLTSSGQVRKWCEVKRIKQEQHFKNIWSISDAENGKLPNKFLHHTFMQRLFCVTSNIFRRLCWKHSTRFQKGNTFRFNSLPCTTIFAFVSRHVNELIQTWIELQVSWTVFTSPSWQISNLSEWKEYLFAFLPFRVCFCQRFWDEFLNWNDLPQWIYTSVSFSIKRKRFFPFDLFFFYSRHSSDLLENSKTINCAMTWWRKYRNYRI